MKEKEMPKIDCVFKVPANKISPTIEADLMDADGEKAGEAINEAFDLLGECEIMDVKFYSGMIEGDARCYTVADMQKLKHWIEHLNGEITVRKY
jgi:hypothetical protein